MPVCPGPAVGWRLASPAPRARGVAANRRAPVTGGRRAYCWEAEILQVGRWKELKSCAHDAVVDLGDALVLPGLINAHCHLDYTDMAGQISPLKSFSDWIKAMLALKAHWTYSDYAARGSAARACSCAMA